ncbi:glyoxalase-like domain-containing protein [Pochonia chlamydosporia 170]|uniref:Bleomycin resistance protein n=1 Tax=Pochonia chlamydosporia 170 TaxID=1380566 RepID=A0A179F522_METCM|nr:glyoxalase-like domain-containing protein [Pochonia chlamydosporia 170]OAQ60524.1 glyoxalase-like domain-containing protein [Pochonia chlamydosporia 170]
MAPEFHTVTPILRIFDLPKANEFYLDYLGFKTDWEHRFDDNAPLYRQISKGSVILHLSEHHGDGSPGVRVRINTTNLADYHAELAAKKYRYMRPGLDDGPVEGSKEVVVLDPFGNTLIFCEDGK